MPVPAGAVSPVPKYKLRPYIQDHGDIRKLNYAARRSDSGDTPPRAERPTKPLDVAVTRKPQNLGLFFDVVNVWILSEINPFISY